MHKLSQRLYQQQGASGPGETSATSPPPGADTAPSDENPPRKEAVDADFKVVDEKGSP
jgi:hypothetical protein